MNWKRKLAGVLAAALLTGCLALPAAAADPVLYADKTQRYQFEKLTHPEKPTGTADGIVDYLGGGVLELVTDPEHPYYNAGARGQSYSWAALGWGDWLYVGTCYAAMGNTLTLMRTSLGDVYDEKVLHATFDAMFNGTFFNGEEDGVNAKGVLVKINTKTGETKVLMSASSNGFSPLFRNAVEYKGKLYFCGSVRGDPSGAFPSVWQIDPETDECKQVYKGLADLRDYQAAFKVGVSTGVRGMCVYKEQLVISNVTMDAKTGKSSATLLISSDPEKGFAQIADSEDLFNYPAYRYQDSIYGGAIWDMVEYNGSLYVSLCTGTPQNMPDENTMQSFALVRGDQQPDGSFVWTAVAGDQQRDGARYPFGLDPERTRSGAANLSVYNGYLYIGEYNDEEIALERILFAKTGEDADGQLGGGLDCRFLNANLEQSVNLYRMAPDESLELVVGDATAMFPEGSLSGIGSGFGRHENQYIWRMQEHEGKLYIGTFDTSSLLQTLGQFVNGDLLRNTPQQWSSQAEYTYALLQALYEAQRNAEPNDRWVQDTLRSMRNFVRQNITTDNILSMLQVPFYLARADRGFDLYVTEDGVHFETLTTDGFGDPYNHGLRVFAQTDQGLCIGTANPFYGTQVWLLRNSPNKAQGE